MKSRLVIENLDLSGKVVTANTEKVTIREVGNIRRPEKLISEIMAELTKSGDYTITQEVDFDTWVIWRMQKLLPTPPCQPQQYSYYVNLLDGYPSEYRNSFEEQKTDWLTLHNSEICPWGQGGNNYVIRIKPGGYVMFQNTAYLDGNLDHYFYLIESLIHVIGNSMLKVTTFRGYENDEDYLAVVSTWTVPNDDWLKLEYVYATEASGEEDTIRGTKLCSGNPASPNSVQSGPYDGDADSIKLENVGDKDIFIDTLYFDLLDVL